MSVSRVTCRTCGQPVGLVQAVDGAWKVVELTPVRIAVSLPRMPIHVVTFEGQVVSGLRDQQEPRYIEGHPYHWPQCKAA